MKEFQNVHITKNAKPSKWLHLIMSKGYDGYFRIKDLFQPLPKAFSVQWE